MRRGRLAALVLAVVAGTLGGASRPPALAQSAAIVEPRDVNELVAAVKKEGANLNIAWASVLYGGPDGMRRFVDGIDKKYHLHLNVTYTPLSIPGGAFESQVVQEVKSGQTASTDVLFNVHVASEAPFMQQIDWHRYVPGLPERAMYFDHRAVAATTIFEGITYNTKLIPPDKVPHSLADLLKPEWKGKIATPPYEGIEASYLGLPQVLGQAGLTKFIGAFSQQLGGLIRCGSEDRIVSGEFLMFALDCGDSNARLRGRRGEPIAESYPKEGAGLYLFAVGIPRTAGHPYAARLLVTYMLSREGQDAIWDTMGSDNYQLAGSHMAPVIAEQRRKGVKIIDAFALDVQHPELNAYERLVDEAVNAAK